MRPPVFLKSQRGKTTLIFITIAVFAVIVGIFVQTGVNRPKELPEFSKTIILPTKKTITYPDFTDHKGKQFNKEQFLGKWSIVFFGFTNCPDICPTTMQTLKQVKQSLQASASWTNYQTIMVTVDPETDNSKRLDDYVTFFDPEFIGLTADKEITAKFAKQLGILFIKRERDGENTYEVDHSASIILINPQGQWAGVISAPHKTESISADLEKLAQYTGKINISDKNQTLTPSEPAIDDTNEPEQNGAPLTITNAWIRPAPPSATSLAAYFDIQNNTNKTVIIVDSSSEAFDATMIHNTEIKNGIAKMVSIDGLTIPAKSQVSLAPLGTHMMLMRPETPLKEGDTIGVILIDENGNEYPYQIPVRQQPN